MTINREVEIDQHVRVGPFPDVGGHGPITYIDDLMVCLDCGYLTDDRRMLAEAKCRRSNNEINTTWRERLEEYPFPAAFDKRSGDLEPRDH